MRLPSVSRARVQPPVAPCDLPRLPRRLRRRPRPHVPHSAPSPGSLPPPRPQLLPRPRVTLPCLPSRACLSSLQLPLSLLPLPRRRRILLCLHLPACRRPARPHLLSRAAPLRQSLRLPPEMPPFLRLPACRRPPPPHRHLPAGIGPLRRRLNMWPPSTRLLPSSLCPTTCTMATRTSLPTFPPTAMALLGTSLRPPRPSPQRLRRLLVPQFLRLHPGLPHPSSPLVSARRLPLQPPLLLRLPLRRSRRTRSLPRSLRLPLVPLLRPSLRFRHPRPSLLPQFPVRLLVLPLSLRPARTQPPGSPSSSRPASASPSR